MSRMKEYAENVSVGLGHDGEINDYTMTVAERFLGIGIAAEYAEATARICQNDPVWCDIQAAKAAC